MSGRSAITTAALVRLQEVTNHTFVLPLVIFYPTSRCNSRCMSCDWWKQSGAGDLTLDEIEGVAASLPALGTDIVVFSGGEPLLRPEVFEAAGMFRARGIRLHLLTSGVLLERCAESAAEHFARVVISLDATTEALYQAVRGVAALGVVGKGMTRLRQIAPGLPVTARATLHRANFRELPRLIDQRQAHGVRQHLVSRRRHGVDGVRSPAAARCETAGARPRGDRRIRGARRADNRGASRRLRVGVRDRLSGQAAPSSPVLRGARRSRPVSAGRLQRTMDVGGDRGGRRGAAVLLS